MPTLTCLDSQLELIKLFVERVDKLRSLSYVKDIINADSLTLKLRGDMKEKALHIENPAIDPEHLDAFLFTLRLFVQKGDSISIERIGNIISSLNASKEPKDRFLRQQAILNKHLAEKSMVVINGETPTNDDIFRTVLYGNLGHLKTEQAAYQRYREWTKVPALMNFIEFIFNNTLITYMKSLNIMANNCRLILEESALQAQSG